MPEADREVGCGDSRSQVCGGGQEQDSRHSHSRASQVEGWNSHCLPQQGRQISDEISSIFPLRTKEVDSVCRTADILVVAVGRPEMIKKDWVKRRSRLS